MYALRAPNAQNAQNAVNGPNTQNANARGSGQRVGPMLLGPKSEVKDDLLAELLSDLDACKDVVVGAPGTRYNARHSRCVTPLT